MLGSSRVTLHDTELIPDKKIFNLAMDDMRIYEFDSYIEYAKKRNGKEFDIIILGLDFLTINKIEKDYQITSRLAITEDFWYPYKSLISYDTLLKSIRNLKNTFLNKYKNRFKTYDQNHIAHSHSVNPNIVYDKTSAYIKTIQNNEVNYNRVLYIQTLHTLKEHNPNTKFIVFITPLPGPIVKTLLANEDTRKNLTLWTADLLNLFGPYYDFMTSNPITRNFTTTFVDHGHYNTSVAQCIDEKIFKKSCSLQNSEKFGIIINNKNVDSIINITSIPGNYP
jgi:hypothetical protein